MNEIKPEVPPIEETPEVLRAKIAQLEQDKISLTGELTDNRPKLREANDKITLLQEQLQAAVQKNDLNPEDAKIAEVVARVLSAKDTERAAANRKAAFDRFVNGNKDYHPDNDLGGLKRAALETEFASFNTQGAVEIDDFLKFIGKAHALLRGNTPTTTETTEQPFSSMPSSTTSEPTPLDGQLSQKEVELIANNGWTKDKYLALKAKMPEFIADLLQ